jgi:hypothetical protein
MKKKLVTILFCALTWYIQAQDDEIKFMVMGVPQQMANNCIRIDLDLPLATDYKWLVLSPQFWFKEEDISDLLNHNDYNTLIGGGIDGYSKIFISRKNHGKGLYFSYGGGYRMLRLSTSDYLWEKYLENDLVYYTRVPADYSVFIHGITGKATTGFQFEATKGFLIDLFIGFGVRLSIHDNPEGSYIKYNYNANDYGYTGTFFVGGARLGIGLD